MKRHYLITFQFVVAAFVLGFVFFDRMPEIMVTHWNVDGQADGVSSRIVGVWLMPFMMLGLYGLMLILPSIDPKSKNIQKFRHQWHNFMILLFGILLYMYGLTLYWNLGNEFNFIRPVLAGVAVLMFGISRLLTASEQNFSIGIRTPWTLSSETVWRKTHKLGARLFLGTATIAVLGMLWPEAAFFLIVGSAITVTIGLFIYSYVIYRQESEPKG